MATTRINSNNASCKPLSHFRVLSDQWSPLRFPSERGQNHITTERVIRPCILERFAETSMTVPMPFGHMQCTHTCAKESKPSHNNNATGVSTG
eukprot:3882629-Amphidinium_carterae.1